LKCKDDYRVDLLVHNGHVKDRQKLVDDANVKLLELQLALGLEFGSKELIIICRN
jgi:hypothetical protein